MVRNGHEIIRRGYANGTHVADIAKQCGSTPGSVRVIAKRLGIRHSTKKHLDIPAELRADYRVLMALGRYRSHEAVQVLGLEAAGL